MSVITTVVKRTNEEVPYDSAKIKVAIEKAFAAGFTTSDKEPDVNRLTETVQNKLLERKLFKPKIEEIQDCVEETLMEFGYTLTARNYVLYRAERARIRDTNSRLMQVYEYITLIY